MEVFFFKQLEDFQHSDDKNVLPWCFGKQIVNSLLILSSFAQ